MHVTGFAWPVSLLRSDVATAARMIAFAGNVRRVFHRFALCAAMLFAGCYRTTAGRMGTFVVFGKFDFHGVFLSRGAVLADMKGALYNQRDAPRYT
jgi:hypothetical protein